MENSTSSPESNEPAKADWPGVVGFAIGCITLVALAYIFTH
jgi:hypothetical protein